MDPIDHIHVFAAISLTDALTDIARDFEQKTGRRVLLNFAGSDVLRFQIEKGFPADIYISADDYNVKELAAKGWCTQRHAVVLLRNELVVVGPLKTKQTLDWRSWKQRFMKGKRALLAIGDPRFVPAGRYALHVLKGEGIWPACRGRVIPAMDVRAALSYVEQGVVDWAMVYRSDARVCRRCRLAAAVDSPHHPRIAFTLAVAASSWNDPHVRLFLRHLFSARAAAVFDRYGFEPDLTSWTDFLQSVNTMKGSP